MSVIVQNEVRRLQKELQRRLAAAEQATLKFQRFEGVREDKIKLSKEASAAWARYFRLRDQGETDGNGESLRRMQTLVCA